jgi:AcrR family transcriptional regulator
VSPRRSVAEAARTRDRLVARATEMASTDGLEGVTVGRLADAAGVSKSGVTRHFATKEQLQLETFAHAIGMFTEAVWAPVAGVRAGRERLLALCETWTEHLAGDAFPGGCFLTAAAAEFDGREGPVRDAVRLALARWLKVLAHEARVAIDAGELAGGTDPDALAYELNAFALAANQARQLLGDDAAPARSRALMRGAILARA